MTKLSPAVQAVLDAYEDSSMSACLDGVDSGGIAASLRVAADGCNSDWMGLTVIHHLYAIADELVGN